jgi:hypothetical protein
MARSHPTTSENRLLSSLIPSTSLEGHSTKSHFPARRRPDASTLGGIEITNPGQMRQITSDT